MHSQLSAFVERSIRAYGFAFAPSGGIMIRQAGRAAYPTIAFVVVLFVTPHRTATNACYVPQWIELSFSRFRFAIVHHIWCNIVTKFSNATKLLQWILLIFVCRLVVMIYLMRVTIRSFTLGVCRRLRAAALWIVRWTNCMLLQHCITVCNVSATLHLAEWIYDLSKVFNFSHLPTHSNFWGICSDSQIRCWRKFFGINCLIRWFPRNIRWKIKVLMRFQVSIRYLTC